MAITVKHPFVSTVPDAADTSIVRPSNWNADHTVTGLGTAAELNAGVPNGVATLDAGGKVPTSQIPLQGDLNYQGTWNATTNTPTLTSSTGTQGYYYVVDVAGTTNLNGITDWKVGDWAIFNGSVWQKVDNTDAVTSVNGQVGTVVLTTTNIAEGTNEYFTTARARQSVSAGTGISYDNSTGVITNSAPDQTVAFTDGTGIDVTGTYPNFTVTNTAPDQIVALTGAGTTTVTGTYPNFTITSNDEFDGDVVGPASATDNAIARFDTTTGKLIQNSVVTIDDTGNASGILSEQFSDGTAVTLAAGKMWYNGTTGSWNMGMGGGNITQQVGEEIFIYGKASAAITEGELICKTGAVGASGVITFAPSPSGLVDNDGIIGVATENIAHNAFGRITSFGVVRGINTTGSAVGETWADGDTLWYNPFYVGGLTKFKPTAPNVKYQIATVINAAGGGAGSIQVNLLAGSTLGGTDSNVQLTSVTNGNILSYDGSTSIWKNTDLTAGTAISVSKSAGGVLTVANTAPDQVVALTGAGTTTISGTYPNFTITSNDQYTGTVTSVTGTAPVVSSGGTTPAISMAAATGSVNGYLTSTDWTTFNSKAPAVTYTTNYVPYGQGTTTPALSADFTYNPSLKTLTAPQLSASNGLVVNSNTVAASYSIPSGSSASSVGPMTVASGQTVTVPSGSRWVVL